MLSSSSPVYVRRFYLSVSDHCSCGGIGPTLHYAMECALTVSWPMRKPAPNFEQEWLKRVANNLVSRHKIHRIVKFISFENLFGRPETLDGGLDQWLVSFVVYRLGEEFLALLGQRGFGWNGVKNGREKKQNAAFLVSFKLVGGAEGPHRRGEEKASPWQVSVLIRTQGRSHHPMLLRFRVSWKLWSQKVRGHPPRDPFYPMRSAKGSCPLRNCYAPGRPEISWVGERIISDVAPELRLVKTHSRDLQPPKKVLEAFKGPRKDSQSPQQISKNFPRKFSKPLRDDAKRVNHPSKFLRISQESSRSI
ncbi:hypothetical protein AVEN_273614-1 [Araneus ventricosus]|uniref:Uncharacterized protein n=1 Tax=Araneus ventricosus TaxID=182803 RepID=A0A4Y2JUD3_ARAVE|nr:hypothetical protein AVEN_273614-1 [Araneus ventricosus]